MSPEGPQPPMILLQQLLAAATQPSPVKAVFARQELEVPVRQLSPGQCVSSHQQVPFSPFPGSVPWATLGQAGTHPAPSVGELTGPHAAEHLVLCELFGLFSSSCRCSGTAHG